MFHDSETLTVKFIVMVTHTHTVLTLCSFCSLSVSVSCFYKICFVSLKRIKLKNKY
ncbi:hypothetical protein EXN66_Car000231 [Channa argus]|uniref:Uncharacterized protein n=1 Tax=Channa argus TaxID=215402 RepID=A0A6G1QXL0_CHAAH|nr:hypothetical protein EXN66_Car000231 [Channa argus]